MRLGGDQPGERFSDGQHVGFRSLVLADERWCETDRAYEPLGERARPESQTAPEELPRAYCPYCGSTDKPGKNHDGADGGGINPENPLRCRICGGTGNEEDWRSVSAMMKGGIFL